MRRSVLGIVGFVAAVVLVGVVFMAGRITATPTADAAGSGAPAETSTTRASTTTTIALVIGDAIADAGEIQLASLGALVTLNGGKSSDPSGASLEFLWTQVGGPDVTGGRGSLDGETPTFEAPDVVSTLVFELTVDDGEQSDPDAVMIQVVEDAGSAVFVDLESDRVGLGNGTMDNPARTLGAGIGAGAGGNGIDLYLKTPSSVEYLVAEGGLALPPNTSVYGGYGENWVRDVSRSTSITGASTVFTISVEGRSTVLSGLSIIGTDSSGGDAVALVIGTDEIDGGSVTIEDSIVVSGNALDGSAAASIGVSAMGVFDLSIVRSSITSGDGFVGPDGEDAPDIDPSLLAAAGEDAVGRTGGRGGVFNYGGDGGDAFAGRGGTGFSDDPPGRGGLGGAAGEDGEEGSGAENTVGGEGGEGGSNDVQVSGSGRSGKPGVRGAEGGGGGGGGGKTGLEGGGGGGGGEGGLGGFGGFGALRGGRSIGLYVAVEGTVIIDSTEVSAGKGGDGGGGSAGSPGALGAFGGNGARGACSFLGCGAGRAGDGGNGSGGSMGSEGGQGGGGAGGPSIGVLVGSGAASVIIKNSVLRGGEGGTGGQGGVGGRAGSGADGQAGGQRLVPGLIATTGSLGASGGSSFGLYVWDDGSGDAPVIEGSELFGGIGGEPGESGGPQGDRGVSLPSNP